MPRPKSKLNMSPWAYQIVRRYRKASVALSWKGSRDPAEFDEIETEYRDAMAALQDYIAKLEASREDPGLRNL